MKFGIIGFGKMGILHGALLNSMDGVELSAICDSSKTVVKAFGKLKPNVACFVDYKKMIDTSDIDAVIVSTPTFLHAPIAQYAAQKKLHVFLEKPLALNAEEGKGIKKVVSDNNTKLMVGFSLRYNPSCMMAKQAIASGEIGQITQVRVEAFLSDVMREEKGWRFKKALSGGGVVIDFTIHAIDFLVWLLGPIAKLEASARSIVSREVEDEVQCDVTFENGALAQLKSSWSNPSYRKSYFRVVLEGSKGTIDVTDQTIETIRDDGEKKKLYYPNLYDGYYIDIAGANFSSQMLDFKQYCMGEKTIETDIDAALYVQHIIDGIYTSAANNNIFYPQS